MHWREKNTALIKAKLTYIYKVNNYLGVRYGSFWVVLSKTTGASSGMLRKIRQKATKWTTIPRNTTEVRLKRLFLHSNPNSPPPDRQPTVQSPNITYKFLRRGCVNLPTISPTPTTIPEIPIRPLAESPNWVVAPIHVPYTPLQKDSSRPAEQKDHIVAVGFYQTLTFITITHFQFNVPLYAMQGHRSRMVVSFRRCRMVSEQNTQYDGWMLAVFVPLWIDLK